MNTILDSQRLKTGLLIAALVIGFIAFGLGARAAAAAENPVPAAQGTTPTPSPTRPGQINLPTATSTQIGGPTATPSRTPTLTPVLARLIGTPTNLRSGPGLNFEVLAELDAGTELPLIGRWLGYDWLLVQWEESPTGDAWVYEPLVQVIGDITTVPAVEPPAEPTTDPFQAALDQTATIDLQTPGGAETATARALSQPTGVFTATPDGGNAVAGVEPTFTPPDPYVQPDTILAPRPGETPNGPAPAVIIISLGAMGLLTLGVGLLRRL